MVSQNPKWVTGVLLDGLLVRRFHLSSRTFSFAPPPPNTVPATRGRHRWYLSSVLRDIHTSSYTVYDQILHLTNKEYIIPDICYNLM